MPITLISPIRPQVLLYMHNIRVIGVIGHFA